MAVHVVETGCRRWCCEPWLCTWWRQGAGTGAVSWLCASWRQGAGAERRCWRWVFELAARVVETGCRCWALAVRVVETAGTGAAGPGAGCWVPVLGAVSWRAGVRRCPLRCGVFTLFRFCFGRQLCQGLYCLHAYFCTYNVLCATSGSQRTIVSACFSMLHTQ